MLYRVYQKWHCFGLLYLQHSSTNFNNSYGVCAIISLVHFSCPFTIISLICCEITKAKTTHLWLHRLFVNMPFTEEDKILIGPTPWGHSGPLCHALSLSSMWTSHAACAIAIDGVRLATPGNWQCNGGSHLANGPNIFQMLLVNNLFDLKGFNGKHLVRQFPCKGWNVGCLQVVAKATVYWVGRPLFRQQQMTQHLHSWSCWRTGLAQKWLGEK